MEVGQMECLNASVLLVSLLVSMKIMILLFHTQVAIGNFDFTPYLNDIYFNAYFPHFYV